MLLKKNSPAKFILILGIILFGNQTMAKVSSLPAPPAGNPSPPQSSSDRNRVSFAINAAKLLLMGRDQEISLVEKRLNPPSHTASDFLDKDLKCLQNLSCYQKDFFLTQELNRLETTYGKVTQMKHAHIMPEYWQAFLENQKANHTKRNHRPRPLHLAFLKPDEYIVKIYVQFSKKPAWHNLHVVLTEGKGGKIALRHLMVSELLSSSEIPLKIDFDKLEMISCGGSSY